ncbi:hypothetical protein AWJ20_1159 [Sugiyamaella lignohabitans]|uniref:Flavin reductase like domain-containing protein n=1 Tax=Sugiyamaella lignohabitans TaxID=796027 RepID=A0A167DG82_9ASCO|nr:uncharacterized protein AWJ20_1159 [Sugiyamaella lignohabitans]ANB12881.1 hypothetical protein AWJ20_1159 [Sugiyamaella lignohabitans]
MVLHSFPLKKVCQLIEPGPIVLVTTRARDESINVMTMGFHMMLQHHHPTLIACSLGPWDYSFNTLKKTKECVIAVPTVDMAETVVDIGNCSGDEVNKFREYNLTAVQGSKVKAPLIGECLANLECVVENTSLVSKYDLFVLRVVRAWIDKDRQEQRTIHHLGQGKFIVAGDRIDLQNRMVKWRGLISDDDDDEEPSSDGEEDLDEEGEYED